MSRIRWERCWWRVSYRSRKHHLDHPQWYEQFDYGDFGTNFNSSAIGSSNARNLIQTIGPHVAGQIAVVHF